MFDEDTTGLELAPSVTYEILPNELVIDLESTDNGLVQRIITVLEGFGCRPFVTFSGRRGYHLHVLLGPSDPAMLVEFIHHPDTRKFTLSLFELIVDMLKQMGYDASAIDTGILEQGVSRGEKVHTIRAPWSVHPKVSSLAKIIWNEPVEDVEPRYPIWYVPKGLAQKVLENIKVKEKYKEMLEDESFEERPKLPLSPSTSHGGSLIWWIEAIIGHPEMVKDGRRRLLLYVLIPYLVNVRELPPEVAVEVCRDWLSRTPRGMDRRNEYLIEYEVPRVAKKGVLPMARVKFLEKYPDLRRIINKILLKEKEVEVCVRGKVV